MIKDDQNYYDQKNFKRNDSGLGADAKNSGIAQENVRQDINGATDKPFPQERNWTLGTGNDGFITKETDPIVTQEHQGNAPNHFGQVKYARREGAVSIYKDVTRNTANDNAASAKAEGSTMGANQTMGDDYEEEQGGSI
jgi:hypothetical protein